MLAQDWYHANVATWTCPRKISVGRTSWHLPSMHNSERSHICLQWNMSLWEIKCAHMGSFKNPFHIPHHKLRCLIRSAKWKYWWTASQVPESEAQVHRKLQGCTWLVYIEKHTWVCSGNSSLTGYSPEVRQISLETAVSEIVKDTAVQLSCNCGTGFPGRRRPLEYSSWNLFLSANYTRVLSCWSLFQAEQTWMKGMSTAATKDFKIMWYINAVSYILLFQGRRPNKSSWTQFFMHAQG